MEDHSANDGGCLSGHSCCMWGCIGIIVMGLLAVIGGLIAARLGLNYAKSFLDDKPAAIAVHQPTADEVAAVHEKTGAIKAAYTAKQSGTFRLSADEINTLIVSNPDMNGFFGAGKGKINVSIAGGKMTGEVSIPMDKLGMSGKYLNGTATFGLRKTGMRTKLFIEDFSVGNKPVPAAFKAELRRQDLLQRIYSDPNNRQAQEVLDRISDIRIEDEQIIFTLGGSAAAVAAPAVSPAVRQALPTPEAVPAE